MTELLGKRTPQPVAVESGYLSKICRAVGLGYCLAILIAVGAGVANTALFPDRQAESTPDPYSQTRVLGDIGGIIGDAANAAASASNSASTSSASSTDPCDSSTVTAAFNPSTIFPIVPGVLLGDGSSCSPPYWGLGVFKIFAYKILSLLNYIILITAILMTFYAGILYLSGFANEKNTGTAKTMLISVYTGLVISLSATLILRTTITVFADQDTSDSINQNNSCILDQTTCPSPN